MVRHAVNGKQSVAAAHLKGWRPMRPTWPKASGPKPAVSTLKPLVSTPINGSGPPSHRHGWTHIEISIHFDYIVVQGVGHTSGIPICIETGTGIGQLWNNEDEDEHDDDDDHHHEENPYPLWLKPFGIE